jgi:hypothetical protein
VIGRGKKARILVQTQVPYDVPVGGRCCDLVKSSLSNEELSFSVPDGGVAAHSQLVRQRPLFQKLGPETKGTSASGKAGLTGFSETNPSLCTNSVAKDVPTGLATGRTLDHIFVSALIRCANHAVSSTVIIQGHDRVVCLALLAYTPRCCMHAVIVSLHSALRAHRLIGCGLLRLTAPVAVAAENMPCS